MIRRRPTQKRPRTRRSPGSGSTGGRVQGSGNRIIGRDLARTRLAAGDRRRWFPALLVGAVLAALGLAALRVEVIRQRYELAEVMQEEKRLLEERAGLTARMRGLRDPARLADFARDMDFGRPDRVIELGTPQVSLGPRP